MRQFISDGGHRHADLYLGQIQIVVETSENLIIAVIEHGNAVWHVSLEAHRGVLELTVRYQLAGSANLTPLHVT